MHCALDQRSTDSDSSPNTVSVELCNSLIIKNFKSKSILEPPIAPVIVTHTNRKFHVIRNMFHRFTEVGFQIVALRSLSDLSVNQIARYQHQFEGLLQKYS